jgi:hypothetical protein
MQKETSEPLGSDFESPRPPHWLWRLLLVVLTGFGVMVCICFCLIFINPRGVKSRAQGQLTACKSNCKNLATALEMYASDNRGHYPAQLSMLTQGNYLKMIPTCPAAGSDTYLGSYRTHTNPDRFSFFCQGNNHSKAYAGFSPPYDNFPQYTSEIGLNDHP